MNVRNIAFVGHPSSGKTTLVDAMAFALGASDRKGSVGDKTSICDTEPEEQERQHTLQLSAVHAKKDGTTWNLLDTPGYPEFIADATSAMFAAEMTVGVVSCGSGVTFNVRHYNVGLGIMRSDFVYRDDIGMVEGGRSLRLALEARENPPGRRIRHGRET